MNEELLYNQLYDKTKDCGRTQFVKLLMEKERENKNLKDEIYKSNAVSDTNRELAESYYKENQQLKEQLQNKQDIINGILDYIDSNKFVEEFKNVVNERNVRNEILNRIEKSDK